MTISVVVPTIPTRRLQLDRLKAQLAAQTRQPDEVIIWEDMVGAGAAVTRNIGLANANSDYIAFFDDDDIMYGDHLARLERAALSSGSDLVYPSHDLVPAMENPLHVAGEDPYGRPFDEAARRQIILGYNFIPCAVLVRRDAIQAIGGFTDFKLDAWDPARCELADAWRRLLQDGAKFVHCPHKTWAAVRNGNNTAGLSWPTHLGTKQKGYD